MAQSLSHTNDLPDPVDPKHQPTNSITPRDYSAIHCKRSPSQVNHRCGWRSHPAINSALAYRFNCLSFAFSLEINVDEAAFPSRIAEFACLLKVRPSAFALFQYSRSPGLTARPQSQARVMAFTGIYRLKSAPLWSSNAVSAPANPTASSHPGRSLWNTATRNTRLTILTTRARPSARPMTPSSTRICR